MTDEQEKKAAKAFMRTSSGVPIEFYSLARVFFERGFKAGLEAAKEQPASICRGCGHHNDGFCDILEADPGKVESCKDFLPVAFDEKNTDCYVGIKPCGCMVAWVSDILGPDAVSESVRDFVKSGYKVERAKTDDVIGRLGRCKCVKSENQKEQSR